MPDSSNVFHDIKISELPVADQANATDQLEANQSGTTRSITLAQVAAVVGGAAPINISATPPAAPIPGMLWWHTTLGELFVWYIDADLGQWVPATPTQSNSDPLSVRHYGVLPTNPAATNTANLVTCIAAAYATGVTVLWPAGTYPIDTTTPIPNFHDVRHSGPGILQRSAITYYPCPTARTHVNELHVDPAGNDANDGLHPSTPMLTWQHAVDVMARYGPALQSWELTGAAGSYAGGIDLPRGMTSLEPILIKGAPAGGGVPTTIIAKSLDTAAAFGFQARNNLRVTFQDLKFLGNFANAIKVAYHSTLRCVNVHVDGVDKTGVGISVTHHNYYQMEGGDIANCLIGVSEMFSTSRAYNVNVSSLAEGTKIHHCVTGVQSKDQGGGHFDFISLEDNTDSGMELHFGNANIGNASFKRNGVSIMTINGEVHDDAQAIFATGADAPTTAIHRLEYDHGALNAMGWTNNNTGRVGYRRPAIRASLQTQTDYNGGPGPLPGIGLVETTVLNVPTMLPAGVYNAKNKRFYVEVHGEVFGAALVGTVRIKLFIASTFGLDFIVPTGTASGSNFRCLLECVCWQDGDFQQIFTSGIAGTTAVAARNTLGTVSMVNPRDVSVRVQFTNIADSVRFFSIEVFG